MVLSGSIFYSIKDDQCDKTKSLHVFSHAFFHKASILWLYLISQKAFPRLKKVEYIVVISKKGSIIDDRQLTSLSI